MNRLGPEELLRHRDMLEACIIRRGYEITDTGYAVTTQTMDVVYQTPDGRRFEVELRELP